MKIPQIPNNEQKRLKTVKSYNLLDSLPESEYDDITNLVATICDTPIALISLLDKDRNFFKSHLGIPFSESPRDISFCGHAILENDILIINDARKDERFMDNPLVLEMKAIFYRNPCFRTQVLAGCHLGDSMMPLVEIVCAWQN